MNHPPKDMSRCFRVCRSAQGGDLEEIAQLRRRCFGTGSPGTGLDRFDQDCDNILVRDNFTGRLVACLRIRVFRSGADLGQGYAGQYYDLSKLRGFDRPVGEVGRLCAAPGIADPAVWRLAFGELTRIVREHNIALLVGCSSFPGISAAPYRETLLYLGQNHLAPSRWRPGRRADETIALGGACPADHLAAMAAMPPPLRTYLKIGGWVSDHAVVDRALNTLHVFTGVEIARVPPAWASFLQAGARPRRPSPPGDRRSMAIDLTLSTR